MNKMDKAPFGPYCDHASEAGNRESSTIIGYHERGASIDTPLVSLATAAPVYGWHAGPGHNAIIDHSTSIIADQKN